MPATQTPPPTSPEPWLAQGELKRSAVQAMFADIAPGYDRMNRLMTGSFDRAWRKAAVRSLQIKPGEFALDACCGTGDFLPLLRADGAVAFGLDFCLPMLERADSKVNHQRVLMLGDACRLPLRSESIDVVTVGWGIRNVPDIDLAHREIFRVLKPRGRFVSIDMAIPENPIVRSVGGFVTQKLLPTLGALLSCKTAYRYLPESTQRFMTRQQLCQSMTQAGFKNVTTRDFAFGNVCLHRGEKC